MKPGGLVVELWRPKKSKVNQASKQGRVGGFVLRRWIPNEVLCWSLYNAVQCSERLNGTSTWKKLVGREASSTTNDPSGKELHFAASMILCVDSKNAVSGAHITCIHAKFIEMDKNERMLETAENLH